MWTGVGVLQRVQTSTRYPLSSPHTHTHACTRGHTHTCTPPQSVGCRKPPGVPWGLTQIQNFRRGMDRGAPTHSPLFKSSVARKHLQRLPGSGRPTPTHAPTLGDAQRGSGASRCSRDPSLHTGGRRLPGPRPTPRLSCRGRNPPGTGSKGHALNLYMPQGRKSISMPKGGNYCNRRSPATTSRCIVLEAWTGKKMPQHEVRMLQGLK